MSEYVNEIMERMVPDLQDLEANSIFSHVIKNAQKFICRMKSLPSFVKEEIWNMPFTVIQEKSKITF